MKVRNAGKSEDKVELQMTPMIDIVFQLLVFFIMTFKVVSQEGDFNIKMPLAAPREGLPDDEQLPPMVVKLSATSGGQLAQIQLNDKTFGQSFSGLRTEIKRILGDDRGPNSIQATAEIELDCSYNLHYSHVIEAVTAVSGFVSDNGEIIKLVEKIKFAPPKKPAGG